MGLKEQIDQGASFVRKTVTLGSTNLGSTEEFGKSYMLLNVTVNNPCRIRLYSNSASLATDAPRTTASMYVSSSVGLILDTYIASSSYTLYFDPPIIGTTFDISNHTWFNISGSDVTARFNCYPIESSFGSRQALNIYASSISPSTYVADDVNSPRSFLILSASCNYANTRLRLYSRTNTSVTTDEKNRGFSTLPDDGSYIISDMMFDSASYGYILSPTLQAYNLTSYTTGSIFVGYVLNNLSAGSTITNVTASLYIYSLED